MMKKETRTEYLPHSILGDLCWIIKIPSEIDIKIDHIAQRYITGSNKKIDIRGPVFITVNMEII